MNPGTLDPNDNIGNTIRFKTQHITQIAPITGILVAVCDSRMANAVSDIARYHVGVEQGRAAKSLDPLGSYEEFTFIVIEDDGGKRIAYALDWIDDDGYEVLVGTQTVDIRLIKVSQSDVSEVLTAIQAMGVSAKVIVD